MFKTLNLNKWCCFFIGYIKRKEQMKQERTTSKKCAYCKPWKSNNHILMVVFRLCKF